MGDQKEATEKAIDTLFDKLSMRSTDWWCEALKEIVDSDQLIERIRIELKASSVVLEK